MNKHSKKKNDSSHTFNIITTNQWDF